MITALRNLIRRRQALVTLSEAQRMLLTVDARTLRTGMWPFHRGSEGPARMPLGAVLALLGVAALVVMRPRTRKLASAALAVYPVFRRLLPLFRRR
ncbi:MAG: hypothetical protein KIS79_09315 [Burkholderiales bacterium]|nr:hypothetical protein [Burkholderiales bacterium]